MNQKATVVNFELKGKWHLEDSDVEGDQGR